MRAGALIGLPEKRVADMSDEERKEYHRVRSREHYRRQRDNPEFIERRHRYKQSRHRERKRFLVELLGGACSQCGFADHPAALDFHHTDPAQKRWSVCVHLVGKPLSDLIVEAMKCDLLCANCHRIHHWDERSPAR